MIGMLAVTMGKHIRLYMFEMTNHIISILAVVINHEKYWVDLETLYWMPMTRDVKSETLAG